MITGMGGLAATACVFLGSVSSASEAIYYHQPMSGQPFSEAVRAGDLLIVSGQIGKDSDVPGAATFDLAAHRAMDRIGDILVRHGSSLDDVVKCTVMLRDIKNWSAFNAVYVGYFRADHLPARSAFEASGLAENALLEVECWAYAPMPKR
ncbi:MAG: Endoribonuclease [Bradyrhizobium sp.]|nr:Endoribonuclease [Bradyrhizobium sp.]